MEKKQKVKGQSAEKYIELSSTEEDSDNYSLILSGYSDMVFSSDNEEKMEALQESHTNLDPVTSTSSIKHFLLQNFLKLALNLLKFTKSIPQCWLVDNQNLNK